MPAAPALITGLLESAYGRDGQVTGLTEPAPGFLELEFHAAPPPGGWQPGHEVEFRVAPTLVRHYTITAVAAAGDGTPARLRILADTEADGPGTRWLRALRPGQQLTVIAARHRPLRLPGTRRLYLGDSSAAGAISTHAASDRDRAAPGAAGPVAAVEVPAAAAVPLASRCPGQVFLPAGAAPGEAGMAWLARALADGTLAGIDGAVLLGHAQSIQQQRRALLAARILDRRAITARPYWSAGKRGL